MPQGAWQYHFTPLRDILSFSELPKYVVGHLLAAFCVLLLRAYKSSFALRFGQSWVISSPAVSKTQRSSEYL